MSGGTDPRTPVIIGAGQVNYPRPYAPEPVALLEEAAVAAASDAGGDPGKTLATLESIRTVRLLSRRYSDVAALLAERIGASPRHRATTCDGGNHPQAMVNRAAREIAEGRVNSVLIGGAESWRTRSAYKRSGEQSNWSNQDPSAAPDEVYGPDKPFFHEAELAAGVDDPTRIYPIFETALRAKLGLDPAEHRDRLAALWSRFSEVAGRNPYAAIPRLHSPDDILGGREGNRMICYPYPKLLNSNNSVDQSAVILLCSVEHARRLGTDPHRWVFPWAGADAYDIDTASPRADLAASPAIRAAGRTLFEDTGTGPDDLEFVDIYSCFPSAVQIAAAELGLDLERQLTLTGGMTFAGGPWNNYSTHAIATLVPLLRERPEALGLITANGGMLAKHALGLYSGRPRPGGFAAHHVQPPQESREVAPGYRGDATAEAYTVVYERDGSPARALVAALTPSGARACTASTDPSVIERALAGDLVGRTVTV